MDRLGLLDGFQQSRSEAVILRFRICLTNMFIFSRRLVTLLKSRKMYIRNKETRDGQRIASICIILSELRSSAVFDQFIKVSMRSRDLRYAQTGAARLAII